MVKTTGGNKSTKKRSSTRSRASTVFYENNSKRCSEILSNHKRCPKDVVSSGGNWCKLHETIRKRKMEQHKKRLRERGQKGGTTTDSRKPVYEYNYYFDDEIEPFDSNASLVTKSPPIWIGSIDSAHDLNYLRKNKIKSIINASGMEPSVRIRDAYKKMGVDYYTLSEVQKVPYKSHYRVSKYLGDEKFSKRGLTPREFFKFMHKGCQIMNNKGFKFPVLINCHMGINRSGSLIAAYLMTKPRPYSYEKTVDLLEKANNRRNLDVLTNNDFKRALKYFPIFMGTESRVSPRTMANYKQFLSSYER